MLMRLISKSDKEIGKEEDIVACWNINVNNIL